jgi:hypothetical protein
MFDYTRGKQQNPVGPNFCEPFPTRLKRESETNLVWIIVMFFAFLLTAASAWGSVPPYERGDKYSPLLTHAQLERGLGYIGSLSRLKKVMSKFKGGLSLHITAVGGSVTAGLHGVGDGLPWPQYLFNFLQDAYKDQGGEILGVNAAVPGELSSLSSLSSCICSVC